MRRLSRSANSAKCRSFIPPRTPPTFAQTSVKLLRIAHVDYQDMLDKGIGAAYKLSYTAVESLAQRLRRMDEWLGQLLADHPEGDDHVREWNTFREKLFNRWSL